MIQGEAIDTLPASTRLEAVGQGQPGGEMQQGAIEGSKHQATVRQLDPGVGTVPGKGRPGITQRVYVIPPGSQIGPITDAQRADLIKNSLVAGTYEQTVDRESAYELLAQRGSEAVASKPAGAGATTAPSAPNAPGAPAANEGGLMGEALLCIGRPPRPF